MAAVAKRSYAWEEDMEDYNRYDVGGFHPTHIGDQFNQGRYQVVHKLGHGSCSIVWLARDLSENRHVALKIFVASVSDTCREGKVLRAFSSGQSDHQGRPFVTSLMDEFSIEGPNGRHICIVTAAAGCSLAVSKDGSMSWKFPVKIARSMAAQILLGLDYIHSCGVVHGDLHSNNILFQVPSLGQYTTEELYERIGAPKRLPLKRIDRLENGPGTPKYVVAPACIGIECEDIVDAKIIISDFKSFFQEKLGCAADIWTAACTLYEILGECDLFNHWFCDSDRMIPQMISALGILPEDWWKRWEKRSEFFHEDCTWNLARPGARSDASRPLSMLMLDMGRGKTPETFEFGDDEMASLEKLLKSMLVYKPSDRITSKVAVDSEWMEKWGRPDMETTFGNATLPIRTDLPSPRDEEQEQAGVKDAIEAAVSELSQVVVTEPSQVEQELSQVEEEQSLVEKKPSQVDVDA